MKIATVLFTYNRSWHAQKTIEALHNNTILPEKLYIFHDGLQCEEHREGWEAVKEVIKAVDWCDVTIVEAKANKGLANSIVDGINMVFLEYDAVIVLEDDCVSHPLFMKYSISCLNKYKDNKKVFSVNGCSWNVDIAENGTDAYFIGRTNSCGWATWKDRWELYQQDYKMLNEMRKNPQMKHQIDVWGQDLEKYMLHNVDGRCDSWAVFWSLQCIRQGGFCPTPYFSLIDNIGFDGTGVHSGTHNIITKIREWKNMEEIVLPDKVEFPENYEDAFANLFKWISPEIKLKCYNRILLQWNMLLQKGIHIIKYFRERNIERIGIWGKGNLCRALLYELHDKVEVKYIIESNPKIDQYEKIPIIHPDDITDEVQSIVVIPIYDMAKIQKKMKNKEILIGLNEILECLSIDF